MSELGILKMVKMSEIQEPGHQLRKKITEEGLEELAKSMAYPGLENPIKLRNRPNGYEIVSGHRRFLAAQSLGWEEIKSIVEDVDDETTELRSIHENLHREDMSPIEEGNAVKRLVERHGCSKKDVAKLCKKSESWVSSRLDLLEMPSELQEAVDVGAISVSAARELNGITDDDARRYYLDYAIKQGATAILCAFWRGKWEVEKTVNDPSAYATGAQTLNPPPTEVLLKCFWCECDVPIQLLNHIRVCPKCTDVIYQAHLRLKQDEFEESRAKPAEA